MSEYSQLSSSMDTCTAVQRFVPTNCSRYHCWLDVSNLL